METKAETIKGRILDLIKEYHDEVYGNKKFVP